MGGFGSHLSYPDDYDDIWEAKIDDESWRKSDDGDSLMNSGYTEDNELAECDLDKEKLSWDPVKRQWYCRECFRTFDRAEWFGLIGAYRVPGKKCLTQCQENYPLCKNWCAIYKIPKDDPMLS